MEKEKIVELLRKDMQGEQQAIVQYLYHAYGMEEGEIPAEIEAIAREEMRHFDWLGDAIVELGGDPSMHRDPPDFSSASPQAQMLKNVDLEQVAIDQYRAHIEAIDNEHIRLVLGRILHDELVHKGQFAGLAEAVEAEEEEHSDAEVGSAPEAPPARLAEILNQGIRHEYSVVLQYIYHSLVTDDKELGEELMNAAINEMQHMGWLAEEMVEHGGDPEMEHHELFLSRDPVKNLEADIAIEQLVTRDYTNQISELHEPDLKALVARIRDHEVFHDALFKHLLEEVQEGMEEGEAEPASAKPCEPAEPEHSEPQPPPSVGSLI